MRREREEKKKNFYLPFDPGLRRQGRDRELCDEHDNVLSLRAQERRIVGGP